MSPATIPSRVTSPARMSACNRDRLKSLSRRARKRSSRSPASSALTDTWKRLAVFCVVMILRFDAGGLERGWPTRRPALHLILHRPARCILRNRPAQRVAHPRPTAPWPHFWTALLLAALASPIDWGPSAAPFV